MEVQTTQTQTDATSGTDGQNPDPPLKGGGQQETEQPIERQQNTPVNYEEEYKTNRALASFIDKLVTKSNQTAVDNAIRKQQRLNDERLSESERLKEMTAEQRAGYCEQKFKDLERAHERSEEINSMRTQTAAMLAESSIPDTFLDMFNFVDVTAEEIEQRVHMLRQFEYHPKGTLEKLVAAGVNEKLKQAPPESRQPGSAGSPQPKSMRDALEGYYGNKK